LRSKLIEADDDRRGRRACRSRVQAARRLRERFGKRHLAEHNLIAVLVVKECSLGSKVTIQETLVHARVERQAAFGPEIRIASNKERSTK
jgi:hypothetical protein